MKTSVANTVRANWTTRFIDFLREQGEDVGQIDSHTVNFPITVGDEEGWIQVVVKVPTKTSDDEEYQKRKDWIQSCEDKRAKAEEKARKDAERKASKAEKKDE